MNLLYLFDEKAALLLTRHDLENKLSKARIDCEYAENYNYEENNSNYNKKASLLNKVKEGIEAQLICLDEKINQNNDLCEQVIETSNSDLLIYVRNALLRKIESLEIDILDAEKRCREASEKAVRAFNNRDYSAESKYNNVSSDCFYEMKRCHLMISYYTSYVNCLGKVLLEKAGLAR